MIFLKNGSTDFFYFGHFGKPKPYRITWYMSQSCTFFLSIDKKNSRSAKYAKVFLTISAKKSAESN